MGCLASAIHSLTPSDATTPPLLPPTGPGSRRHCTVVHRELPVERESANCCSWALYHHCRVAASVTGPALQNSARRGRGDLAELAGTAAAATCPWPS